MSHRLMIFIIFLCLLFFVAVGLDISPYLRGPSVDQWRWSYWFVDTLDKIWLPGLVGAAILGLFWWTESGPTSLKLRGVRTLLILTSIVVLSFAWQLSVIQFSRANIRVLYHRTTDRGINGYYSAGLAVEDFRGFIADYPQIVNGLPMHAKGHPPGMPLTFFILNFLFRNPFAIAIGSPFLISFLSGFAVVFVYLITKSFRAAFFTVTIPAFALFLPLPDVIFPLFGLVSALLWVRKREVAAGIVFGIGLFFSYSILPVTILFWFLKKGNFVKFVLGILGVMGVLRVLWGYDFAAATVMILTNQAHRPFWPWVVYNQYDFVVFLGIPLAIVAWLAAKNKLLLVAFFVLLSVFSRAETGRIWLPLMVFAPIGAAPLLASKKVPERFVMILLGLQMIQTLVIQEFWVPLW